MKRRTRKKIHMFGLKLITGMALFSLLCLCAATQINMKVVMIALVDLAWLSLMGAANER